MKHWLGAAAWHGAHTGARPIQQFCQIIRSNPAAAVCNRSNSVMLPCLPSPAVAIAMHNVPEGICVAMPIYYATGSKWKVGA